MVADLVPLPYDHAHQVRMRPGARAGDEECCVHLELGEQVEERRRSGRVRAVVEGEGHGAVLCPAAVRHREVEARAREERRGKAGGQEEYERQGGEADVHGCEQRRQLERAERDEVRRCEREDGGSPLHRTMCSHRGPVWPCR